MNSTNNGNEPPPSEDEDRSLLFGSPKEGTGPAGRGEKPRRSGASASPPPTRSSPPAADAAAAPPDPAGRAGPETSSDGVLQQILALLEDQSTTLAGLAAREADLAAVAGTITGQADRIAAATEWVNKIKAAISDLLASTGQHIEGLKSGNKDLDAALAQLNILKEGLDKVVQALDATAKGLDRRSSELGAVKQELAKYYEDWTAEAKTSLAEMKALSKRLDAGDHMVTRLEGSIGPWTARMEESIGANSAAQLAAAEKTAGNVDQLATTGSEFLANFDTARGEALKEARQEWTRIRRWTLPALALALVLATPSAVVVGAVGQSELGVLEPYDDTRGWKPVVWGHHGQKVKNCMLQAQRTNEVVICSFDVPPPMAVQQ